MANLTSHSDHLTTNYLRVEISVYFDVLVHKVNNTIHIWCSINGQFSSLLVESTSDREISLPTYWLQQIGVNVERVVKSICPVQVDRYQLYLPLVISVREGGGR